MPKPPTFPQTMARKYLRKYRVMAPPVPVEYMLFEEGIQVEVVDYEDDTAGECWWDAEVGHVAVSRVLGPGRLRFTLAHEWGHLVLRHHDRRFTDLLAPASRYRDAEEGLWDLPDPVEVEANQFAAELLMPLALFQADWRRVRDARKLAARYEVSQTAVTWRLRGWLEF